MSKGNGVDFGDRRVSSQVASGTSNKVRGLMYGGQISSSPSDTNIIDFITFSTLGDSTDFGDSTAQRRGAAGMSDCIRAVYASGYAAPGYTNVMDYVQIMTKGNAIDFGDATDDGFSAGTSNAHGGL